MDIKRWTNITLRSLHLVGLLGVASPILFQVDEKIASPWILLTIFSGIGLLGMSILSNKIFLIQLRGIFIIIKLLLLALIPAYPSQATLMLVSAALLSGFIAHAPGNIRYYSIFHRRRLD